MTQRRIVIFDPGAEDKAHFGFIWYVATISGEDVREALVLMAEDNFDQTLEWDLEDFYSSGGSPGADYWLYDITGIDEIPDDLGPQDQDTIDLAIAKSTQLGGYCHDDERE